MNDDDMLPAPPPSEDELPPPPSDIAKESKHFGELKITFSAANIDKSADIPFIIDQAVIAA